VRKHERKETRHRGCPHHMIRGGWEDDMRW
jgi:hypothetical protein